MRIIITKNGEYIIKQFEEENSEFINDIKFKKGLTFSPRLPKLTNLKSIKEKLLNPSKTSSSISNLKTLKRKQSLSMMKDYFNRDELKINKKELEQAKKIKISKKKVQLSQKFLEKYLNLDNSFKEKLDNLSNLLNTHKDNNKIEEDSLSNISPYKVKLKKNNFLEKGGLFNKTTNSFTKNRKIKIGEIISKPNLIMLKSYLAKNNRGNDDVRIPLDKNNQNSFNFRTKYENKKDIKEELDNILNLSINTDRKNLINYLKRNSISPHYFKNLLKYDESQIYKLNKMCGFIMNKENNKNFSEKKNNKNLKNKILENSSTGLSFLLNKTNKILNDYMEYEKCQNNIKKKGFKEMIKNTKKNYWDKFRVEKLYKRKMKNLNEEEESNNDENTSN